MILWYFIVLVNRNNLKHALFAFLRSKFIVWNMIERMDTERSMNCYVSTLRIFISNSRKIIRWKWEKRRVRPNREKWRIQWIYEAYSEKNGTWRVTYPYRGYNNRGPQIIKNHKLSQAKTETRMYFTKCVWPSTSFCKRYSPNLVKQSKSGRTKV